MLFTHGSYEQTHCVHGEEEWGQELTPLDDSLVILIIVLIQLLWTAWCVPQSPQFIC